MGDVVGLPIAALFIVFGGLCFVVGVILGGASCTGSWQGETIKRGLAIYDPKTGKWQWKESDEHSIGIPMK